MSQRIPGQPRPDLQDLGHRHQSPWWSSPPPQCIREDPSQRKPQYVESGRVEEFFPHGFFTTPPPGPPKPPPPPPPAQVPKPKPMPERPPRSSSPAPATVAQEATGRGRGQGYPPPPAPSATAPRAEEDPAEAAPSGGSLAPGIAI